MGIIYSPFTLIISAFIVGLSHQPMELGFFAWFGLVPLVFVYNRIIELKHFIITGFIWGFFYYFTIIFWLATNIGTTPLIGFISMFTAVCFLSLNIIGISIVMWFFKKKYSKQWFFLFPIAWVSMEYIRSFGSLAFPWTSLANTQTDFLTLIQNAEITGMYGISFWIVSINILIFYYIAFPFRINILIFLLVFIIPWCTGKWLTPSLAQNKISMLDVAILQPNIHLSEKWKPGSEYRNINSLLDQSDIAIKKEVDLVIWPETSTSKYILQGDNDYIKRIQSKLKNSALIAGIQYYSNENNQIQYYNSAALIQSDSIGPVYHKLHLVPMAEYIPLSSYFSSLKELNLGQANFTSGVEYTIMDINGVSCAVMICFESTFPSISREFVKKGAEILVYVVNDGWYENPPEPQQHAKQVIYRAIENRRPVIRCANTGISMVVDESGNIFHQLPLNEKGMIETTIQSKNKTTLYTKYGDIFSQLNVLSSLLLLLVPIVRKK